jgi:hypothetical protein
MIAVFSGTHRSAGGSLRALAVRANEHRRHAWFARTLPGCASVGAKKTAILVRTPQHFFRF